MGHPEGIAFSSSTANVQQRRPGKLVPGAEAPLFLYAGDVRTEVRTYLKGKNKSEDSGWFDQDDGWEEKQTQIPLGNDKQKGNTGILGPKCAVQKDEFEE